MRERQFLLLVALTAAAGPVGLQIFLPCLPAVREAFGSSLVATQWAISLPMLLLAPALLLYGPAADRFGRRPVLLVGIALFVLGTVGCLLATSLPVLIAARVLQTIGGAAGMVLGRAMLSDRYSESALAGKIATVTMATVVLPTVSPFVGGLISEVYGWRAVFFVVLGLSLPLVVFTLGRSPEPAARPARENRGGGDATLLGLGLLAARPVFRNMVLQCAFSQAVFLAFIAAAPHLMVDGFGRPASDYGLFFILLAASFIAGNYSATRLPWPGSATDKVRHGSTLALTGVLVLTARLALGANTPWALFGPMMIVVFANGLTNPYAQSTALAEAPGQTASAAGVISFSQQVAGAALIQLGAWSNSASGLHLAFGLLASAMLAFLSAQMASMHQRP